MLGLRWFIIWFQLNIRENKDLIFAMGEVLNETWTSKDHTCEEGVNARSYYMHMGASGPFMGSGNRVWPYGVVLL